MELVQVETVRDALSMLNKRAGKDLSGSDIALLAMEYTEDFEDEGVTAAEFDLAYRRVRKEANGYIPNSGRFLEVIREERARPRDVPQLTDGSEAQLTPAEIERNKRRIGILMDQALGKITESEARKRMQREMSGAPCWEIKER